MQLIEGFMTLRFMFTIHLIQITWFKSDYLHTGWLPFSTSKLFADMTSMGSPKCGKYGPGKPAWSPDAQVISLALLSRGVILVLSVLLDLAIPDHDPDPSVTRPFPDLMLPRWLLAFTRWDAAHFLNIAHAGYQDEKDLAFLPLLPAAMNGAAKLLHAALPLGWGFSLLFGGLIFTNLCFVVSAWLIFRLGLVLLQDRALAFNAARVFCFSPANIFFSCIYTESPFAACTLGAMLLLQMDYFYLSAAFFGLAGAFRSNGLINIGFLACHVLLSTIKQGSQTNNRLRMLRIVLMAFFRLLLGAAMVISPFVAFQSFAVWKECRETMVSEQCESPTAEQCSVNVEVPLWCQSRIPSAYSHIQAKYWQGGFLRYWQFKQIPNFLLASPALTLTVAGVCHVFKDFLQELQRVKQSSKNPECRSWIAVGYIALTRCPLLPHAIHWGFLAAYIFFFANVQISTRLLASACPIFHWFLASILRDRDRERDFRAFLKLYIGLFNVLGVSMHVNFLPWTWKRIASATADINNGRFPVKPSP